jgi:hypothetical protein
MQTRKDFGEQTKMIKLDTDCKKFSFTTLPDALNSAMSNIVNQAGTDATFALVSADSKLWLCGVSTSFVGLLNVDATVEGQGCFALDTKILQGIVKGRSVIKFTYTGTELEFKALKTKYSGKMVTLPVTKDQALSFNSVTSEKVKGTVLTEQVLADISRGIKSCAIKNVVTKESENCLVKLGKNKLVVSSFDDFHMMVFTAKTGDGEIKFSINPLTMLGVEKALSGKFEMSVKEDTLRFSNKRALFVIPTSQAEDEKYNIAPDYLKNVGESKFGCQVDLPSLVSVCENLDAIHTANSQFDFALKDGLEVKFQTESGSAVDKIEASDQKGKGKCSVEPKAFLEVLNLHKAFGTKSLDISGYSTVAGLVGKFKGAKLSAISVLTSNEG